MDDFTQSGAAIFEGEACVAEHASWDAVLERLMAGREPVAKSTLAVYCPTACVFGNRAGVEL